MPPRTKHPKKTATIAKAKRPPKRARSGEDESCFLREDSPEYGASAPRFIDLFCGIGGFRLAFERAGGRCVFSSDYDRFSQQTYEADFGERPHGHIYTVAIADILDCHRSAAFVLENGRNLKAHDGGKTFAIIHRTLTEHLGYTVYFKVIEAQGVVTHHRERVPIVGSAYFGEN